LLPKTEVFVILNSIEKIALSHYDFAYATQTQLETALETDNSSNALVHHTWLLQ